MYGDAALHRGSSFSEKEEISATDRVCTKMCIRDRGLIERLQGVLKDDFVRLPYKDGIKILEDAVAKGHKFEFPV